MSYTQLKTDVTDWMHRGSQLDTKMDTFCLLTEADINKNLRSLEMETRQVITIDDAFTDVPVDYLETRAIQVTSGAYRIGLKLMTPDALDGLYSGVGGRVRGGSIHGGQLELRPAPTTESPTDVEWSYYNRVDTLTANATNDILDNYPLLYLAGMLVQANKFVQDDEQAAYWSQIYDNQMAGANKVSSRYHLPSMGIA